MPPSFRPETTLNRRALRREAIQLGVVAVASLAALLSGSGVLQVIAAIGDILAVVLTSIAATVAWRVGGRAASLGVYLVFAAVFAALAVANLAQ
ncbi:MAG: hypothetical protein ACXVRJ_09535 [Gaiellaceae bacterium]